MRQVVSDSVCTASAWVTAGVRHVYWEVDWYRLAPVSDRVLSVHKHATAQQVMVSVSETQLHYIMACLSCKRPVCSKRNGMTDTLGCSSKRTDLRAYAHVTVRTCKAMLAVSDEY